jgi:hypothetical protein
MIDFVPYFAGLITLLFGIAFAYAIFKNDPKKNL